MSRVETTVHFRYLIQKTVLILFFVIFLFYNIGLVPVLVCNFYFVVSFCYFGLLYIKDFRKNKHIYRIILIVVILVFCILKILGKISIFIELY